MDNRFNVFSEEYNNIFINKLRNIHGDKYDYNLTKCTKLTDRIIIICKTHGQFLQRADCHLRGGNCLKCRVQRHKLNTNEFIARSIKIHGNKYDYFCTEYISTEIPVKIKCNFHDYIFLQTPHAHIGKQQQGCPKCANNINYRTLEFVKKAKEKHGDKYDYSNFEYKNSDMKSIIICKKHKTKFLQTPHNHLRGNGCPKCKISKGELAIEKFLKENNIQYDWQKKFEGCINPTTGRALKFDFYLPDYNFVIEYDGELHYSPFRRNKATTKNFEKVHKTQQFDKIKTEYCINNKIELLRIHYDSFKNIETILANKLLN